MIDISAVGATVDIKWGSGKAHITEFSDEGTPFECPDVDLSNNKKNLNGIMISSRTPSVYTVSVTVIPGSQADKDLSELAVKSALQDGAISSISEIEVDSIQLTVPEWNASGTQASASRYFTWTFGRLKSGPTGPSTSADGRMRARTYKFEMQNFFPDTSAY